jgi:hypothetical protein
MTEIVVRVFTPARRFSRIIGRFPDGTKIPLGPYSFPQATAAMIGFILAAACLNFRAWLALPIIVITLLAVWAIGYIPETQIPIRRRLVLEMVYLLRRSPRSSKH